MIVARFASALGKGLVAGVVGTAAMTVSSTVEAKRRGRDASTAPADAATKVLGVQPKDKATKARFSNVVHWTYGSAWGTARGVLAELGLGTRAATAVHFLALWSSEAIALPALGVSPPVSEWGATEIAIDAGHQLVYVLTTSAVYAYLDRQ